MLRAIAVSLCILVCGQGMTEPVNFMKARPIWPKDRATEMNLFAGFRTILELPEFDKVELRLTASTLYRVTCNGEFVGHGPTRGPHGYYRVDHWELDPYLQAGKNVVAIEVAGYNVNSYYLLDQPSFLQAEIVSNNRVLASTGAKRDGFKAKILDYRTQKVQRYSFQRPFIEIYSIEPGYNQWLTDPDFEFKSATCSTVEDKNLLPRGVPYPVFSKRQPLLNVSKGSVETGRLVEKPWKDRSLTKITPEFKGYPEDELVEIPSLELQGYANTETESLQKPYTWDQKIQLKKNGFQIFDFGTNLTGFIGLEVSCKKPAKLVLTFDEILRNDDVDFKRMSCVNAIVYHLQPGQYTLESFEPYTLQYLKLTAPEGACQVQNIYLREYVNPDTDEAHFICADNRLNRLFTAGRETFRQNAVDIFMDCPSRERAGWLCDSFFTSRVAKDLCGDTRVEKNFYENFLLPERFEYLPEGMLPMCYPADHNDGVFIPNWALWFVVQLEEYAQRSGDRETVDALETKVEKLFAYFEPFRNKDGLLEKLESWVFVEWSEANKFTQDVNYPSNMLYAAALSAAGRMYDRQAWLQDAKAIQKTIQKQSFDGTFFVDNAIRKDGKLTVTQNRSEVCQYFAFFFDIATPKSHPELWNTLRTDFGPNRKETKKFPEIHAANSFVGNVLRLEILSRYGYCQQILDESAAYLLYMAEQTGTLWENTGAYASCNHGFASHIVHTLVRDVAGIYNADTVNKKVTLRFADPDLAWCETTIPTDDGPIHCRWEKDGNALHYRYDTPAGYSITIENLTGKEVLLQH